LEFGCFGRHNLGLSALLLQDQELSYRALGLLGLGPLLLLRGRGSWPNGGRFAVLTHFLFACKRSGCCWPFNQICQPTGLQRQAGYSTGRLLLRGGCWAAGAEPITTMRHRLAHCFALAIVKSWCITTCVWYRMASLAQRQGLDLYACSVVCCFGSVGSDWECTVFLHVSSLDSRPSGCVQGLKF
jgi:hypothetical protein